MQELTPILLISLIAAVVYAYFQIRQIAMLRTDLRRIEDERETRRLEAENAKSDSRERGQELERLKKELQDTKAKLKKQDKAKDEKAAPSSSKKPGPSGEDAPSSAAAMVHIIENQELEASHRKVRDQLEAELAAAHAELAMMRSKENERRVSAERAAAGELARNSSSPPPQANTGGRTEAPRARADETAEALAVQLEASQRAASERESELRRSLSKAQNELRSAERRANANHQLYQVAKGQLVVTEDKLASLKRKYEGARAPEELRRSKPEEPAVEVAAPAAAASAAPTASSAGPTAPASDPAVAADATAAPAPAPAPASAEPAAPNGTPPLAEVPAP